MTVGVVAAALPLGLFAVAGGIVPAIGETGRAEAAEPETAAAVPVFGVLALMSANKAMGSTRITPPMTAARLAKERDLKIGVTRHSSKKSSDI